MPCFERAHDLARVLEAYDRQQGAEPFELIAIDDASGDATFGVLQSYRPRRFALRAERLERNRGPAGARNRGIELARAPLVAFVGDDILPAPDFVRGHLAEHDAHPAPQTAILGRVRWPESLPRNTLMEHIDGVGAQQFSYAYLEDGREYDFRHLYTANVSLKTDFLRTYGGRFDTDFPYAAFEDAELAYRMARHGLRIRYAARIVGDHYHYHTIWSFSERQYRCGLMADVFVRKHPSLAGDMRVTKTRLLATLAGAHVLDRALKPNRFDRRDVEQRALSLASSYEWTPHPFLDELYLVLLDYFWQKGLIDGVFASGIAGRVVDAYTAAVLAPWLGGFVERAQHAGVQLPWPSPRELSRQLLAARPLLLRCRLTGTTIPELGRRLYERVSGVRLTGPTV
jgi:glycosyltransferase involved in cell wall biosynthesis